MRAVRDAQQRGHRIDSLASVMALSRTREPKPPELPVLSALTSTALFVAAPIAELEAACAWIERHLPGCCPVTAFGVRASDVAVACERCAVWGDARLTSRSDVAAALRRTGASVILLDRQACAEIEAGRSPWSSRFRYPRGALAFSAALG